MTMNEYSVALKLFEVIKVKADSEQQAIEIVKNKLDKRVIADLQIVEENRRDI